MKARSLLKAGICLASLLVPVLLYAAGPIHDVFNTVHNLGSAGDFKGPIHSAADSTGTDEVCVFCHTPHNSGGELPLWNRSANTRTFNMYTASLTLTTAVRGRTNISVNSISRLCLSCHDGMTALNALVNLAGTGGIRPAMTGMDDEDSFDESGVYGSIVLNTNWGPNLGTNLANMHPINFNYKLAQQEEGTSGLRLIGDVTSPSGTGGLKFFDDNKDGVAEFMECPTCHEPHTAYGWVGGAQTGIGSLAYKPFLRKTNLSSKLCLTCHVK